MIAIIKNDGTLVTFKMSTKTKERDYAKRFLTVPESTRLTFEDHGEIPKSDILNLVRVNSEEHAKAFHKGTLSLLKKILNNYQPEEG